MFKIKLKAKKKTDVGNTEVIVSNISASDGEEKFSFSNASAKMTLTRDAKEGEVVPAVKNHDVTVQSKNEDTKVFTTKPIIIALGIIIGIMIILCIISNIKKFENRRRITFIALMISAISLVVIIPLSIYNFKKKDVNGDGTRNYEDSKEIVKDIIGLDDENLSNKADNEDSKDVNAIESEENNSIENLENAQNVENTENLETAENKNVSKTSTKKSTTSKKSSKKKNKYDVNNDGKVDIKDAAKSTKDTTKKTKYTVSLTEIKDTNNQYYITKKDTITLSFRGIIKPEDGLRITKVVLDGKTYDVKKSSNTYNFDVVVPDKAGVHEFKITKVILSNKREIDTSLIFKREILKSAPYVDLFSVGEDNKSFSFKLEDKDNSFISGTIKVKNEKSNKDVVNKAVKKDEENIVSYDFKEDEEYRINVYLNYDLDSNKNDSKNQSQKLVYTHTLSVASNYDFKAKEFAITDAIEKNEKPIITFTSTNKKDIEVKSLEINGKEYNVTKEENNNYEVKLSSLDTSTYGKYQLKIEKIILQNLKGFEQEKDFSANELTFNVLKLSPTIENMELTDNSENKTISVKYNLKDDDKTTEKLTAVLTDSRDRIVESKEVNKDTKEGVVNLSYANNTDGRYIVKFLADCKLGTEKHTYVDKNIGQKDILTKVDIKVKAATISNKFPKKNEPKFTIKYELDFEGGFLDNNATAQGKQYNELAAVTINGLNYDANRNQMLDYDSTNKTLKKSMISTVSFEVPSESGKMELEATRVQLRTEGYNHRREEFYSIQPNVVTIDILRDVPSIKNLEVKEESYEDGDVTFSFDVVDEKNAFEKGKVTLDGETIEFKGAGHKEVKFEDVSKDTKTSLTFYGNYCLDTDEIDDTDEKTHKEKNKYENEKIYETEYGLYDTKTYSNIELTNLKAESKKENNFFEKNEKVNATFKLSGIEEDLDFKVDKVIIDEKEYDVNKQDDNYTVTLPGYSACGEKEIAITGVVLNTGKKVDLSNEAKTKIEVLKDPVSIEDFVYEINEESKNIKLKFVLKDLDYAILGNISDDVKVKISDEDGKEIKTYDFKDTIEIPIQNNNLIYDVKVIADYDRDNKKDDNNSFKNEVLLDDSVSLDKNNIELKSITEINLYKENADGDVVKVEKADTSDVTKNVENYFVEIKMSEMPTVHARVKNALIENGKLVLVLDYDYVVKENDKDKKDIRIEYGKVEDGKASNEASPETLEEFIEKVKKNPSGTYELTRDFDVADYKYTEDALINIDFSGTLDGNGYKIKNLKRPLFKDLKSGADVKNIKFENISLPGSNAHGVLANKAEGAKIKDILIDGFSKSNSDEQSGSLIGTASKGTVIENCKATGVSMGLNYVQQCAGLVGCLDASTVKNSYAIGTISGGYNFKAGLVGNIVGTSTIENSFAKVNLTGNGGCTFGLAGSYVGRIIAKNCLSLSTGGSDGMFSGGKLINGSSNNYEAVKNYDETKPNSSNYITTIDINDVDTDLFKDKLKFSEEIWNLNKISADNTPKLNDEYEAVLNIEEVKDEYDESKETLYKNLMKLMPFFDSRKIVASAEKIEKSNPLYTKELSFVVPVDSKGNIVTYITSDNVKKISKIKLVFNDDTKKEYQVKFDNVYDMVASYRISELKIGYTFNHYVIDSKSQLVNNLTNYLKQLTYADNLDKLTPAVDDSRILVEFYNDVTKKELKEFVLKYLSNSNYTNIAADEAIDDYLEDNIKKNKEIDKILYTYNYFRRFYDLDISGMKLYDFVMFESQGFSSNLTPKNISLDFISGASENLKLNKTNETYNRLFFKYTGKERVTDYIEYIVTSLSNENIHKWAAKQFKGYLKEVNVEACKEIKYTLWDHLSSKDASYGYLWLNYALPILTLPENAGYVLSTPTQFIVGSQRVYITDPSDKEQRDSLIRRINQYADRMTEYYKVTYQLLEDAKYFNDINTIQIDKRFTYDKNGISTAQNKNTTQEPFHKNFNEVVDSWAYADGNAATANGTAIIWRAEGIFDGKFDDGYEYTFHTWSHETAHNMDSRLFMKNLGRRFDAGGEDYADSNLMQCFGDGDIVFNISRDLRGVNKNDYISSNLTTERVDTMAEMDDFYKKLFETVYILDYLEGLAFLELTPEEQSKIAVQVSYPNEKVLKENDEKSNYLKRKYSFYEAKDTETFEKMKLDSIEDLYENRLVIWPKVIASTYTDNRYGGENIYKVHWYQPHNDEGRPDSYSIKWLAYEMLGYKGYEKGYIEYFSNRNSVKKKIYKSVDLKTEVRYW